MGQGRLSFVNGIAMWGGKQTNSDAAIQAADQLARLRDEVAGYNAVAGGHLSQNGTPEPTPKNYQDAEKTIADGINGGGLQALQKSIAMSAVKNRNVLEDSIHSANEQLFSLFGAKYHRPTGGAQQASAVTPVAGSTVWARGPDGKFRPQAQ
jgi:hypothetical protein